MTRKLGWLLMLILTLMAAGCDLSSSSGGG